jgi:hypothetical protein
MLDVNIVIPLSSSLSTQLCLIREQCLISYAARDLIIFRLCFPGSLPEKGHEKLQSHFKISGFPRPEALAIISFG